MVVLGAEAEDAKDIPHDESCEDPSKVTRAGWDVKLEGNRLFEQLCD